MSLVLSVEKATHIKSQNLWNNVPSRTPAHYVDPIPIMAQEIQDPLNLPARPQKRLRVRAKIASDFIKINEDVNMNRGYHHISEIDTALPKNYVPSVPQQVPVPVQRPVVVQAPVPVVVQAPVPVQPSNPELINMSDPVLQQQIANWQDERKRIEEKYRNEEDEETKKPVYVAPPVEEDAPAEVIAAPPMKVYINSDQWSKYKNAAPVQGFRVGSTISPQIDPPGARGTYTHRYLMSNGSKIMENIGGQAYALALKPSYSVNKKQIKVKRTSNSQLTNASATQGLVWVAQPSGQGLRKKKVSTKSSCIPVRGRGFH